MTRKQKSKLAPFWRGFASALDLSPTVSRTRDRDLIDADARAEVIIGRAWMQVGESLTGAMKTYGEEQRKPKRRRRSEAEACS